MLLAFTVHLYTGILIMRDLPRDLPLDPENWVGTPEYMELMEERAKRAHYLAEAMAEEYAMDRHQF